MKDISTIFHLLRNQAGETPDRVAFIVDGHESITYRDWEYRSNAVARGLADRNVAAGDRIALFFDNSEWIDYAVAYFGVLKAGGIAVPLSNRFTGPELESVLERCAATGVVGRGPVRRGARWNAAVSELEDSQSTQEFSVAVAPEDVAEVIYTSGTTGEPKGVACRHMHVVGPITDGGGWPPDWWRACAGGVYLHANALSTAGGQLRLFEPLGAQRMTTVTLPRFDPKRFCGLIEKQQARVVQLVPAVANAILRSGAWRLCDLSSVRVVSLGCAPLPPALLPEIAAAFPGARLVNMYELSEARYAGTSLVHDGTRPDSVGRPRGHTELKISDETGAPLPTGTLGEIWLRWRGLPPQHYFRDADATARVFVDGWTRTGDAGRLDEDGYLYLSDRIKDVIIKGGLNIGSLEVENVIIQHPNVTECAVFGVPDEVHGEEVAAAIVSDREVSLSDLRKFMHGKLPPSKLPRHVLRVPELPRNRSAKVMKGELKRTFRRETPG